MTLNAQLEQASLFLSLFLSPAVYMQEETTAAGQGRSGGSMQVTYGVFMYLQQSLVHPLS